MKRLFLLMATLLLATAALGQEDGESDAGVVSNTGAARLVIPIDVPPGTGDFAPQVAVAYNSQAPDGPFGIGWGIQFGEIRRTGRFGIPTYTTADQFELDGELLVSASSGTGFENYRTAAETFADITYYSATDSWEAVFTDGKRARFGMNPDSKVLRDLTTGPTARWMLSELEDAFGNTIRFTYDSDSTDGVPYPEEVHYSYRGGSLVGGSGAKRSLEFIYEIRPDVRIEFTLGVQTVHQKRVEEVRSTAAGVVFRRRLFFYDSAGYATGRTRLTSTQLFGRGCDPGANPDPVATCASVPQQTFAYTDAADDLGSGASNQWANGPWVKPISAFGGSGYNHGEDLGVRMGDVDGDGRVDLLRAHWDLDTGTKVHQVYLNDGAGWVLSTDWTDALSGISFDVLARVSGFNPVDACTSALKTTELFFAVNPTPREVYINVNIYIPPGPPPPPPVINPVFTPGGARLVDLNGDGRADLVYSVAIDDACWVSSTSYSLVQRTTSVVWLNTGDPLIGWVEDTALSSTFPTPLDSYHYEFLSQDLSGSPCSAFSSTSASTITWNCASTLGAAYHQYSRGTAFVDLDGDGRQDLVSSSSGAYQAGSAGLVTNTNGAWLNTVNGWVAAPQFNSPYPIFSIASGVPASTGLRFVDLNQDGLVDIAKSPVSVNAANIPDAIVSDFQDSGTWLNTGSGWCSEAQCPEATVYSLATLPAFDAEFDAGIAEPVWAKYRYWLSSNAMLFADLNGDGLVDVLRADDRVAGGRKAWIHDPAASPVWQEDARFTPPADHSLVSSYSDGNNGTIQIPTGVVSIDLDANGALDLLAFHTSHAEDPEMGIAAAADLIRAYDNGNGGLVEYTYSLGTAVVDDALETLAKAHATASGEPSGSSGDLVIGAAVPVATSISMTGVDGTTHRTDFGYAHYRWCPVRRSSLGFRVVESSRPDGSSIREHYYQDHGRAGELALAETYDAGVLSHVSQSTWVVPDGGSVGGSTAGANVGRVTSEVSTSRYGAAAGSSLRLDYEYDDNYGYNFVDKVTTTRATGNEIETRTAIPFDTASGIAGLVATSVGKDSAGVVLQDIALLYTAGKPTQRTSHVRERSSGAAITESVVESWAWDVYGNLVTITDPLLRQTHVCYDGDGAIGASGVCPAMPTGVPGTHSVLRGAMDPLSLDSSTVNPVAIAGTDLATGRLDSIQIFNGDLTFLQYDAFDRLTHRFEQPLGEPSLVLLERKRLANYVPVLMRWGSRASRSPWVLALGSSVKSLRRYAQGSMPLALAVSIRL